MASHDEASDMCLALIRGSLAAMLAAGTVDMESGLKGFSNKVGPARHCPKRHSTRIPNHR
jgi:hypothetical protein